jgi:hypothetical protein
MLTGERSQAQTPVLGPGADSQAAPSAHPRKASSATRTARATGDLSEHQPSRGH